MTRRPNEPPYHVPRNVRGMTHSPPERAHSANTQKPEAERGSLIRPPGHIEHERRRKHRAR